MSDPDRPTSTNRALWGAVTVLGIAVCALLIREFVPAIYSERQSMVRDYIMAHPEVISDAIDELQRRQAAAEDAAARQQIIKSHDELFHDAASVATNESADAVNIVEFFDYNCTYCRQSFEATKKIQAQDGVRFVFKEFPILGPGSVYAAKAAIASIQQGQDKYLAFHDAMMTHPGRIEKDVVLKIAGDVGLDIQKLTADMEAPDVQAVIDRNMALARSIGVTGTPAFVVKDELVPGAVDYEDLQDLVAKKRQS